MRVSSNTPAMSRRSMMRGLAFALAGATVPVAAIAGNTARKLVVASDAELLNLCQKWKDQRRRLQRMGKHLEKLCDEAKQREPGPPPAELFDRLRIRGNLISSPYLFREREPWTKDRLLRILNTEGTPGEDGQVSLTFVPTDECRVHIQRLIGLIDERDAAHRRAWVQYERFEKQWDREVDNNWRLFLRIIRTKAETLAGVAAQFEVTERYWYPIHSDDPAVDAAIARIMANARRLIAAQSAEA